MRKMIAIFLIFSLLLCGCGGNDAPVSESTAESPVAEAPVSAEEEGETPQEIPSIHEDGGPTDPVELAKWVWAMADEASEATFASDFDISMKMEIDVDGTYTYTQSTMRIKEIATDTGYAAYNSAKSDDILAEDWYVDGMYYQSTALGNFKTPMTQEEYDAQQEETASSSTVTNLNAESFGSLFASREDNYYNISFSEPTLDTWMAFSGMFTSEDQESATCTDFDLEGYMQCDLEGNVTQLKLDMYVSLDLLGIPMSMSISLNQLTMGYNDEVSIDVPADDESFTELPDLTIPALLLASQTITEAMPALQYQHVWLLTLSEEAGTQVVTQMDDITYRTGEAGLSVVWNFEETVNGETGYTVLDTFANGAGTAVDAEGETEYTATDEEVLAHIAETMCLYGQTFTHGYDFATGDQNGLATLTYAIQPEFVEEFVLDGLITYGVDGLMTEGVIESSYGSSTIWLDASGIIISQLNSYTVNVEVDGVPVSISIQDACDIVAMGDSVTLE